MLMASLAPLSNLGVLRLWRVHPLGTSKLYGAEMCLRIIYYKGYLVVAKTFSKVLASVCTSVPVVQTAGVSILLSDGPCK